MPLACDLSPSHGVPSGLPQLPGDTRASDGGRHTQRKPPRHVYPVPSVAAQPWWEAGMQEAGPLGPLQATPPPRQGEGPGAGAVTRRDKYATNVEKRSFSGGSHQPSSADVGQTPD